MEEVETGIKISGRPQNFECGCMLWAVASAAFSDE